jgi:hypothetical protein|tara:strand:- start:4021 stop:4227 length:207 start_codon:yes stop_codon:yes gene_type:complete
LLAKLLIDRRIPDRTPPVVASNDIMAQFMPSVAAEFGSPKHVEHAYKDPVINMVKTDKILINDIIIFF